MYSSSDECEISIILEPLKKFSFSNCVIEWMNEWNSLFYIGRKLHRLKPGKL